MPTESAWIGLETISKGPKGCSFAEDHLYGARPILVGCQSFRFCLWFDDTVVGGIDLSDCGVVHPLESLRLGLAFSSLFDAREAS